MKNKSKKNFSSKEKFQFGKTYSSQEIQKAADEILKFPSELKRTLHNIEFDDLGVRIRDDGWTIRQTLIHLADSCAHSYIRIKTAALEEQPVLISYDQDKWVESEDSKAGAVQPAILIIEAMCEKIHLFVKSLNNDKLESKIKSLKSGKEFSVSELIALTLWHLNHHKAQIEETVDI